MNSSNIHRNRAGAICSRIICAKLHISTLTLISWCCINLVFAQEADLGRVVELQVSQVYSDYPNLNVYFDFLDANADPIYSPEYASVSSYLSYIDSSAVDVLSVGPFDLTFEGIAYIFLLDISRSLNAQQFIKLKNATKTWIDALGKNDQAALVAFGESVSTIQDFTSDIGLLNAHVDKLARTNDYTQLYGAIDQAIKIGTTSDSNLPKRRIIVVLTDGVDDPMENGITREEVLANLLKNPIPIYTIGFRSGGSAASAELREFGSRFARGSGGAILLARETEMEEKYIGLRNRINRVYLAELVCDACVPGVPSTIRIDYLNNNKLIVSGEKNHVVQGEKPFIVPTQALVKSPPPRWIYAALGVLGVLGLALGFVYFKQRKSPPIPLPKQPDIRNKAPGKRPFDLPSPPPRATPPKIPSPEVVASNRTNTPITPVPNKPIVNGEIVRIRLTVVGGSGESYEVKMNGRLIIGRDSGNGMLQIPNDEEISSKHCELVWGDGQLWIEDLSSLNGTSVEGVPIRVRYKLEGGERITLGRTDLRIAILD